MRSYQLMVDAVADIGKDLRDAWNIDQMCLCTSYGEMECLSHGTCPLLREKGDFFSAANLSLMLEKSFVRYAKQDIDVLYLAPASVFFPLYDHARQVANRVMQSYPEVKIAVADTDSYGIGQGLLALSLAKHRAEGMKLEQALGFLEQEKAKLSLVSTIEKQPRRSPFSANNLPHLRLGRFFGRRPVFGFEGLGQVKVYYRVKGHLSAVARAIESLREHLGKDTPLYLSCVGDQEFLDELSKLLDESVYLCPMSPLMQKWFGKEGCSVAGLSL